LGGCDICDFCDIVENAKGFCRILCRNPIATRCDIATALARRGAAGADPIRFAATGNGGGTVTATPDDLSAVGTAPSPGAMRMVRHRNRRRKGLRCVTIELRESEVDALIRRGVLSHDNRVDPAAVRRALYAFFDDTLR
jgi:hypothetical protein